MNFINILEKIFKKKIMSICKASDEKQALQFLRLQRFIEKMINFKTSSVYFKYNGRYYFYVCDSCTFIYFGKKKIKNKYCINLY